FGRCIRISDCPVCQRSRKKSGRILYTTTGFYYFGKNCNQPKKSVAFGLRPHLRKRFIAFTCCPRSKSCRFLRTGNEPNHLQPGTNEYDSARCELQQF